MLHLKPGNQTLLLMSVFTCCLGQPSCVLLWVFRSQPVSQRDEMTL